MVRANFANSVTSDFFAANCRVNEKAENQREKESSGEHRDMRSIKTYTGDNRVWLAP